MHLTTRKLILGLIVGAAVVCTADAADKTFDQHFTAPPGSQLTLDTQIGSVSVVGHEARDVGIHADLSGDGADRVTITAEQHGSSIEITGRVPGDRLHSSSANVRFTLEVPRDCALDLKSSGGAVEVRGINAVVHGNSGGGAVAARDVTGAVTLRTSGGGITVTRVTGDLDLNTSGGGIELSDVDGRLKAQTSGGGVQIDARSNKGMSVVSSGGPIDLRLPGDVHANIDATTIGGGISMQLSMTKTELSDSQRLQGEVNGGGDQIVLHTSGGGIAISAR